jgi:hypothetical protein
MKFRANQSLHITMKLHQFTEDGVNKILLRRSVMFHILYDTCACCTRNSQGEEAGQGAKEGCSRYLTGRRK